MSERTVLIVARPPDRQFTANGLRATRIIGNQHCYGGETAEVGIQEAGDLIGAGQCDLAEGQDLSEQVLGYLRARCDPMWGPRHGRPPRLEDF